MFFTQKISCLDDSSRINIYMYIKIIFVLPTFKTFQLKELKNKAFGIYHNIFRKTAYRSEKFKHWFSESETRATGARTRGNPAPRLKPVPSRTKIFEKSNSPFMTKLLPWHPP